MKKKEVLFIIIILLAAAVLWGGLKLFAPDHYGTITITVAGEEYGTYSLGKDQQIKINNTNVCEIKNGQAAMVEANCPDHLCIDFAPIGEKGGMIVCLPNRVIIEGTPAKNAAAPEVDVIS